MVVVVFIRRGLVVVGFIRFHLFHSSFGRRRSSALFTFAPSGSVRFTRRILGVVGFIRVRLVSTAGVVGFIRDR